MRKYLFLFLLIFVFCLLLFCSKDEDKQRMLLIDYDVNLPEIHQTLGTLFNEQGIQVSYRPYYPSLTLRDFEQYDIIALFSGKTPYIPGSQLSLNALPHLREFVSGGGTLILGAEVSGPSGFGDNEWFLFNKLLREMNVQIEIMHNRVSDIKNGYPSGIYYRPYYKVITDNPVVSEGVTGKIILDRSPSLNTGEGVEIIAATFPTAVQVPDWTWPLHHGDVKLTQSGELPVIAAAQYGSGHVLVMSRYVFNAVGVTCETSGKPLINQDELENTVPFLKNLVTYIYNLTSHKNDIIPFGGNKNFSYSSAFNKQPVSLFSDELRNEIPDNVELVSYDSPSRLWNDFDREKEESYLKSIQYSAYQKYLNEGIRAGWGHITYGSKHNAELVKAVKKSGINLLWGVGQPQIFLENGTSSSHDEMLSIWRYVAENLENTDITWFIGMNYADSRKKQSTIVGAQGQTIKTPSPLNWDYWEKELLAPLKICSEFSTHYSSVGGIIIDLELYGMPPEIYNISQNFGFEDEAYAVFLKQSKNELNENVWKEAETKTVLQRFHWLKKQGLLRLYYKILEDTIADYSARVKEKILKINPDLIFGFYRMSMPLDWFSQGIMRGFSSPERPVFLFTFETTGMPYLESFRKKGIYVLHATALLLGMTENYQAVIGNSLRFNHGYWLNRITWLVEDPPVPNSIEAPYNQTREEAIGNLKDGNNILNNKLKNK